MREWIPTLSLLAAVAALVGMTALGGAAAPSIEPDAILRHIKFLAADELQGRGNGSEGLERAGDYVAAQFQEVGLRPGVGNEWNQPFEIVTGLDIGDRNELVVRQRDKSVTMSLGVSYYPLAVTPGDARSAQSAGLRNIDLVFAGYGIVAPGLKYDDYAGIDVRGKAVLIFSHEPQENRRDSRLNGTRPLRETTLYAKALAARNRGARALLVVSDPSHETDQVNYRSFTADPDAEDHGIPVLRIRRDDMAPLLEAWGLDAIAAEIERDLVPRSRALPGGTMDYTEQLSRQRRTLRNVVGILPGSDDASDDQVVVLGAHYDHVGFGGRFSNSPERSGEIHNGADDNASGVAALIEMARAAAVDRSRFPRSLVFVAFAGEERGLLGSAHYVNSPPIPLGQTVAMLNLDMIGRSKGWVEVGGLDEVPALAAEVEAAARSVGGIDIRRGGPGAGRSDDSSFVNKRVPALHFFTGFHADYHRPTDDWDQINAPGTARVAALALELAARIAARPERPQLVSR
jgi:hypothetical protein